MTTMLYMHRTELLNLLAQYQIEWPEEKQTIERFKTFVTTHTQCFERNLSIGHVTASAWVVHRNGTHTLLTHHKKLNRWLQLGGHSDGNANVLETALREVQEESGLHEVTPITSTIFDVDIHRIPPHNHEPEHIHYDVRFTFRITGNEAYTVSEESHDLAWVPIDTLHNYSTDPSMLRMAKKWQQHKNTLRQGSDWMRKNRSS